MCGFIFAVAVNLLSTLTTSSPAPEPPTQAILDSGHHLHRHINVYDCHTKFPKAPLADCEALLAALGKEKDSDDFFCPSLCNYPPLNSTVTHGVFRQHKKCKLQAITNIIGGDESDDVPDGCDGV